MKNNESQGDCFILLLLLLRHGLSCSQGVVDWILLAQCDGLLSVSLSKERLLACPIAVTDQVDKLPQEEQGDRGIVWGTVCGNSRSKWGS